jgi:hypothetical protein
MSNRQGRGKAGPRSGSGNISAFKACLVDPFSASALGARMPDEFAFPTATYHSHGTIAVQSPAGYTTVNLALFPHPFLSVVDTNNGSYNSTNEIISYAGYSYSVNSGIYGATSPAAFLGELGEYRVVGAGWKVRVTMPELTRTGRLIFAPIPGCRDLPGFNALNNTMLSSGSAADSRLLGGIGVVRAGTASILNLPGAFEISMGDLGARDIFLSSKPTSASYSQFHTAISGATYYTGTTPIAQGDNDLVNPAGGIISVDTSDMLDFSNMSGWLVHGEGYPNVISPIIDIEFIMHFEGTPASGPLSTPSPVPSGIMKTYIDTADFNRTIDAAARAPWARAVSAGIGNFPISASASGARRKFNL